MGNGWFIGEWGWGMVGSWIYRGIGMGNSWLMDHLGTRGGELLTVMIF